MKKGKNSFRFVSRGFLLLAGVGLLNGCASVLPDPAGLNLVSEADYTRIVEQQTKQQKLYSGFTNLIDASATFLSMELQRAQLDHMARVYQWDGAQLTAERTKLNDAFNKTVYFLSFFVPERKWDDLQKVQTKWKIFLDVNGKRYDGTVKRIKGILADIQSNYPDHTRWHTAYQIEFPVPLAETNAAAKKLTITGAVGAVVFDHP